jgi:hypothetical protein
MAQRRVNHGPVEARMPTPILPVRLLREACSFQNDLYAAIVIDSAA